MTGRGGRRIGRLIAAAAGALALVAAPVVPLGPETGLMSPFSLPDADAAPPPWPLDPSDPSVTAQWGGEAGRIANKGPLQLRIDNIAPQNPDPTGDLSIRLVVENTSGEGVDDVVLRAQRAEALGSAAGARVAMADPEQSFGIATAFRDGFDLGAGESRTITMSVPLSDGAPQGLGITEAGVYPVLINANGRPGNDIDQFLAETRMLVPVDPAPAGTGEGTGEDGEVGGDVDGATAGDEAGPPAPVSLVWPLATDVPLLPGETGDAPGRPELILSGESLSAELSAGGRLDELLKALESELAGPDGPALRRSTCVAIDPELLAVADRMRDGYRIGDERPSPVRDTTRLRDSWGAGDDLDLREGQGAEAAGAWVDRLEVVTRDLCVVTLPWSGAELNAVAATGDPELATEALAAGDDVVAEVLGREPLDSTIIPPEGYLDAGSVPVTAFGDTALPVDPVTAFESLQVEDGKWPPANARTTSLVAANSLTFDDGRIARPGESAEMAPGAMAFGLPVPLSAALAATGTEPEVAGYAAVAGRHDLASDSGAARMQTAVGTLHQEIADAAINAGDAPAAPIVAMPPAGWSASGDEARTFLRAVAATFGDGDAEPISLGDAIAASANDHFAGTARTSTPNPDPGAISGTEVGRATQQSRYLTELTVMMANDPQVALTRHGFTQPLRRDILRALGGTGRRFADDHADRTADAEQTMAGMGEMLQELRDSVTLVAPGGVYTRATDLSPVVIVGRNGLPLPVPAQARVRVGASGPVSSQPAPLPAKGSLTLQVSPEEPGDAADGDSGNELHLWLETADGQPISAPIEIIARTGPSTVSLIIVSALLTIAVGFFAVRRSGRFEGLRRIRPQWGRD